MRSTARRGSRSRGQSLAEFALVLPVFLLLLGGIIQFGLIFWGQNTLNQIVRDTGRWAASQQDCSSGTDRVVTTANGIAKNSSLIGYSSTAPWSVSNVTATWSGTCPPTSNKEIGLVTISITHKVPVFFPWLPGNGNISSTTQFRLEPVPK